MGNDGTEAGGCSLHRTAILEPFRGGSQLGAVGKLGAGGGEGRGGQKRPEPSYPYPNGLFLIPKGFKLIITPFYLNQSHQFFDF